MWFDGVRQPNTAYIAAVSRGKDSTAMLRAIQLMGWPLDLIYSTDVWFDDETPAELPPMVAFKNEWDAKAEKLFGLPVTRICSTTTPDKKHQPNFQKPLVVSGGDTNAPTQTSSTVPYTAKNTGCTETDSPLQHTPGASNSKVISDSERVLKTYCDYFYSPLLNSKSKIRTEIVQDRVTLKKKRQRDDLGDLRVPDAKVSVVQRGTEKIPGFPFQKAPWCNALKRTDQRQIRNALKFSASPGCEGRDINIVYYFGIAADEEERIARHMPKADAVLPLVQIGWDEGLCGLEAQYMDMLSPTYETSARDGCWFCHNQSVQQLRNLYHTYPELWAKLAAIDLDSPVAFKANGHTVHDYQKRFELEDIGMIPTDKTFKWAMVDNYPEDQMTMDELMAGQA